MSSERGLWRTLRDGIGPYGRLLRIESSTEEGIADVVYCLNGHAGWLELKELDYWPKRAGTRVKIPSLTLEQVLFLERWRAAGGTAHLLLQAEQTYLLLDPPTTRALWNGIVRAELESRAIVISSRHLPTLAIVKALTYGTD